MNKPIEQNQNVINEIKKVTSLKQLEEIEAREKRKFRAAFSKIAEKHGFDSTYNREDFIKKYGNDADDKREEFLALRRPIFTKYDYSNWIIHKKISLKPPSPPRITPHSEKYSSKTHGGKINKSKRKTNKRKAKTVRK